MSKSRQDTGSAADLARVLEAERAEKEWLAALLDSMTEEVYFTDVQQRYSYANPAAMREFGHSTISGVPVSDVVSNLQVLRPDGTPRPPEEAPPLRALKGEIIRDEEHLVRTPRTGELRHRQVSAAPVRDASGRIIGSISVVRDVTERTRGEAALRESERQLREADRHKDEFIAVLAHELRNPLVPIRNGIELLKSARTRPELLESVRPVMERQIAHMVRLIDDLLDVARISAGKIELRRAPVALSALIASAVEATRTALDAARLELSVEAIPDLTLHVDATRISQVIANILQNASKFTPPGGSVRLSARVEEIDGAQPLVIRIADTGIGIAANQLPRVFDLFAQAGTHMRDHQGGLGIGLAIARRLVELHGGSLGARSGGENAGSEFIITLPTPARAGLQAPGSSGPKSSLAGLRLLIVDDNPDSADSMAMLAQIEGAQVRVAYSAEQALAAIDANPPEVVLLDIGMPGLNGYEACRRIRAKFGERITLIAVSGWGQDSDKQLAAQAGFAAHLTKPAELETLTRTIARLARR
jgi:signal transduction histidine kinase/CheY-like chemotaxis protein